MTSSIDIILPSLAIGGAEKVMLLLAYEFKNLGYDVRFVVRRLTPEGFQDEVAQQFELINLQAKQVRHFPSSLRQFYKTNPPPAIIIASLWPLTFLTAWVAHRQLKNTIVLCVEHGSLRYQVRHKPLWYKQFLKLSLKQTIKWADAIVGVSKGLKVELENLTNYKGKKLISIPNPIESNTSITASIEEQQILENLRPQLKGAVFLGVGRLKKVKNFPLLLRAFHLVTQQQEASLIILGDGADLEHLQMLSAMLGITDRVFFMGFITNCAPYYRLTNTFVLSSDSEGFGNVIVEALMSGCTIVSTDCPYGPREILADGKYGYLSPVGEVEALAKNMIKSLLSPFPKDELYLQAKRYTPLNIANQYIDVINADEV